MSPKKPLSPAAQLLQRMEQRWGYLRLSKDSDGAYLLGYGLKFKPDYDDAKASALALRDVLDELGGRPYEIVIPEDRPRPPRPPQPRNRDRP